MTKIIGLMMGLICGLFCVVPLAMVSEKLALIVLLVFGSITLLTGIITVMLNRIAKKSLYS